MSIDILLAGSFLYSVAERLLGGGLAESLGSWIDDIINAVSVIMTGLDTPITIMSGIGCSLMIIYFFMDLTNQASRDMFSFDKLVVAFIRLLVAFAILLYAKEIIDLVIKIMQAFKDWMQASDTWFNKDGVALTFSVTEDAFVSRYSGIMGTVKAVISIIKLIFPFLISWICELVGRFLTASTILQLMVRLALAPLAIVQVFEEGTRSSGIRYIKGLFAEAITFGVMLLILNMAIALGNTLTAGKYGTLDYASVDVVEKIGWGEIGNILITQLLCVGGMAGASKITHDVLGA